MELFDSELTVREVAVTVESSSTNVLNVELVETCTRYEAAPVDAAHDTDAGLLITMPPTSSHPDQVALLMS